MHWLRPMLLRLWPIPTADCGWTGWESVASTWARSTPVPRRPLCACWQPTWVRSSARIVQLFQDTDVYDVMPHSHTLISDYSSIIFDYMLLGRPIIYYTPDLEEFIAGCRSFNFHPVDVAVGPLCADYEQLEPALEDAAAGKAVDARGEAHRAGVMKRLHAFVDSSSSERVLEAINRQILANGLAPRA